ncbi:hypothetical protein BS329_35295 [Amycolatopsis coloradensis]|uniref:Carrier domain-containing protein n=1 Tax=Amycolatopsis coloradensis TaxID=76021 RepID=A0A1R0KH96_9PSEU|nr:non-ribosomal peptide synthetase [Amycolatopsis coloradensis]OLZ45018.1 hypothetical protein BS329_35295 [Amycolatopsis coloradensis]
MTLSDAKRQLLSRWTAGNRAVESIPPGPDRSTAPLSSAQRGLWLAEQLAGNSALHTESAAFRLTGPLDVVALAAAVSEEAGAHQALRVTITESAQVVQDVAVRVHVVEVAETAVEQVLPMLAAVPFDLGRAPLLRVHLLRVSAEKHVLLLTASHLVVDAWSLGVFLSRVAQRYAGGVVAAPSLGIGDFAYWEASSASAPSWWNARLAGDLPVVSLPGDFVSPTGVAGAVLHTDVPESLVRGLADAAGCTMSGVLLTALCLLAHRFGGHSDVLVDTPVALRDRAELATVVGPLLNTVVCRVDLSGAPSLGTALGRVHQVLSAAVAHRSAPIEPRPVVRLMFAHHTGLPQDLMLRGVAADRVEVHSGTAKYDLSLSVRPGRDGDLRLTFEYRTGLFREETVRRFAGALRRVLEGSPSTAVADLDLIEPAEHAVLSSANDTARVFPPRTVSGVVRSLAVSRGDAVAVGCGGATLTYAELDRLADDVAARLGVRTGDRVAVSLGRSAEAVAVLLGIWRAGAAYVPVDPALPAERARYLVADSGAVLVVDDVAALLARQAKVGQAKVRQAEVWQAEEGELAYLMYTSGSTGEPKGVAVPHRCLTNLLESVVNDPGLGPDDVLYAVTSFAFDISVLEVFAPLLAGARVEIAPDEVVRDGRALAAGMAAAGATLVQATPSTWRMVLDAGWTGLPGLRAFSGGEALDRATADELLAAVGELWNFYGPTETTIWSTMDRVRADEVITVGRPLANTTCHVLDAANRQAPIGAVGELVIGGAGVTDGYWGRPGPTARVFEIDAGSGEARYRTGDLARYLPDGRIVLLGRADQQVKIRGHRVELGEIEAALTADPSVGQAVVLVDGARLAGFVSGPGEIDPDALRRALRARLPEVMVPSALVVLPAMPLTPNGKADRVRLRALAREMGRKTAGVAPRDDTERAIAALWAEVLGDEPGVEDDFLTAGGDSLSAGRLLARMRRVFGTAPGLAEFHASPTIAAAAAHVRAAPRAVPAARPVLDASALTFQQRQFWLLEQVAPGTGNLAASVRLTGVVDPGVLAGALDDVVARHDALRLACDPTAAGPVPRLVPHVERALPVVDLSDVDDAVADRLARAEASRPFDLTEPPFLRATLLRLSAREWVLLVTSHHIAADGWSVGVALNEVGAHYIRRIKGGAMPGPAPGQAADGRPDPDAVKAWAERLRGHDGILDLPADHGRPAVWSANGATLPVVLPRALNQAVRALAARLRTTPFTVLLAGFAAVLGRYADSDDVVVAVPVANRDSPELEGAIGSFASTVPMRVDLSGRPTFEELAGRLAPAVLADLARPRVPFDVLVGELGLPRDPARPPLAQAMFVYQNTPSGALRLPGATAELRPTSSGRAKYDLCLTLYDGDGELRGDLEHATDVFGAESAGRFVEHLTRLLAHPAGTPLDEVELHDARPRLVPGEWAGRHGVPVHELFRRQAGATPDAVAVRHGADNSVRYRELDAWSDRIAGDLAALGAGKGTFVAVLLPTGIGQVAALLGVLKTGAAFACLDARDPVLRLTGVLDDARPVCLLTDGERPELGAVPQVDLAELRGDRPPPVSAASGGDPLCLVYTSGSSGSPKGIVLAHAAFAQFAAWQRERFGIGPDGRIAQWAPFTYDAAYTEVFAALCAGAELHLPPDEVRADPVAMTRWLTGSGITQIQTVPGFFRLVTDALGPDAGLPGLRHVLLAGEVLPVELAHDWAGRADRPRLHNLYGPTECILATHRELRQGERFSGSVPIGSPIPGREALVLDRAGRACPIGVKGEIHLRGDLLAGEYHRRPEESRLAYPADPWRPGRTFYRTGDLGRWTAGGELEFLGRLGSQLKIRGNRVELEEIEAVLEGHPSVREAAVAAHERGPHDRVLAGYAVVGDATTAAQLRTYLAERLPTYAVPSSVELLDAIPRTRTGKRDRARLPEPARPRVADDVRPGVEQTVAAAWRKLLGVEQVGRHTNFFEAGGHSLLAARLQIELSAVLERQVRLVDIFAHPTIADLAARLSEEDSGGSVAERGSRRRAALRARVITRRKN